MENRYYLGMASDGSVTLQHHGIPGMKWGVRRTPEELGYKPYYRNEKYGTDFYQRAIGRKTNRFMNKSERLQRLYDKNKNTNREKAKMALYKKKVADMNIEALKKLQKEYADMSNKEKTKTRIKYGAQKAAQIIGTFGGLAASLPLANYLLYNLPGEVTTYTHSSVIGKRYL